VDFVGKGGLHGIGEGEERVVEAGSLPLNRPQHGRYTDLGGLFTMDRKMFIGRTKFVGSFEQKKRVEKL
jgi:hypothetical protein